MDEKYEDKIIIKNSIVSVGVKIVEYFLSFISGPLLLGCLGDVKYGIYASVFSLISWIYYFDFGVGNGMRNKVTEYATKENNKKATKTVSTAYVLVSIISIIIFLIVVIAMALIDSETLLNASIPDEELNQILIIAVLIACINFVISLSFNVLYAVQKTALANAFGILSKIVLILALAIYKMYGIQLILYVVIAEGVGQIVKNYIAYIYIRKKFRFLSPDIRQTDFKYSKGILGFGIQIFVMQISALILNATDNLVIMKFFGAADVTPYSFCHKYFSIINALFVAATSPLWTAYTTAYTNKDIKYIKKILRKALTFYCLVLVGICIAIWVFKPFMRIYLGRELDYQDGLIIFTASYYGLLIFSHNFSAFVHGISKVRITTIACVISAIQNVPVSIYLACECNMGLNGIILGSIIGLVISTSAYVFTTIKEIRKMEKLYG